MVTHEDRFVPHRVTVAIVGAGPAGLGVARVLHDIGVPNVWVLERGRIGQSFLNWPADTHLLTPSFPGNVYGVTDLNAISFDSSPGWSLKREHPDGGAYAWYLEQAALAFGLNVQCDIEIKGLEPEVDGFVLSTDRGVVHAEFVIWACGQFGIPSAGRVVGAEHARHYASVRRWQDVPGDEVFVIGGYESGIDAAIGLSEAGKRVTVFDVNAPWKDGDKDPSWALSPFTRQRLDAAMQTGAMTLEGGVEIASIQNDPAGMRIVASDGRSWLSAQQPILATGFGSGTAIISDWFDYSDEDLPLLTEQDESTILPGLFLVGPEVSHNGHLFCFIYKFRQRFAVVAQAIAGQLGMDTSVLELYRANNMYLDDLSCCDDDMCLC